MRGINFSEISVLYLNCGRMTVCIDQRKAQCVFMSIFFCSFLFVFSCSFIAVGLLSPHKNWNYEDRYRFLFLLYARIHRHSSLHTANTTYIFIFIYDIKVAQFISLFYTHTSIYDWLSMIQIVVALKIVFVELDLCVYAPFCDCHRRWILCVVRKRPPQPTSWTHKKQTLEYAHISRS